MKPSWLSRTWRVGFPSPVRVSADAEAPDRPLLVYLHGMGESAMTFEASWPQVGALNMHMIVPTGPFPFEKRRAKKITIGHAWYLYDGGDELFRETTELVEASLLRLVAALERDFHLRPRARVLLGHSMGAYFGYLVCLRNPKIFSHVVGISGNIKESFLEDGLSSPMKPSCLVVHGEKDSVVPVDFAHQTYQTLIAHGFPAALEILPGGHGLGKDRDTTVARWLTRELDLPPSRG